MSENQAPLALTLEEAMRLLADRERVLLHDERGWWIQDEQPQARRKARTDRMAVHRDTWPECMTVELKRSVVARDEASELRAAAREYLQAQKHLDAALRSHDGTRMEEERCARAEKALRRLAGKDME